MFKGYNNYDKYPCKEVKGFDGEVYIGYQKIADELKKALKGNQKSVITLEFYPGVNKKEVMKGLASLGATVFDAEKCMVSDAEYKKLIHQYVTDDRVFGLMTTKNLSDYYIDSKIESMRNSIDMVKSGIVIVYGVGASLVTEGDVLVYCDLARWEIQTRFRKGMPNFKTKNSDAPHLAKFKQGFFFEWRVADRLKRKLFCKMHYLLDTNVAKKPKMVTAKAYTTALTKFSTEPFRTVPYFAPEVWGGQWMKEICGLDKSAKNYAWAFDGVIEENSVAFKIGNAKIEIPAVNAVFYNPRKMLGDRVHARFGDEFPIRFDFLDTMGGGNLSLQVHPLTEYIQSTFGMHYTQDESYYLLDCVEGEYIYLGLKEGVNKDAFMRDLRDAQSGKIKFDADKYINKYPAKKHDHYAIPAGTIHCSATDTMVLEISATPYIFTFKLFDWDRVGLDGLPRPIHIEHGEKNIQWDRTTDWVNKNLVNAFETISDADGILEEKTGLHERQFIETRRHTFDKKVTHSTHDSVNMLNLVEGEEAIVESPTGAFEPFVVHYAETFVIPESVKSYTISPYGKSKGKTLKTIKAFVRTNP
ncbi:MAG: class I mannose-6-phosphate isomerase [Firmicutes bacterium]|nr:class I mannose-6-phosphate isomerase [Bacillota bacterium]